FFQAEDGIRDFHVTGVQTCALPISGASARSSRRCARPYRQTPSSRWHAWDSPIPGGGGSDSRAGSSRSRCSDSASEQLRRIPERLELERVARRIVEEHRRLLADQALEADPRLDHETRTGCPQAPCERMPRFPIEHHAEMRHRYIVAVDRIVMPAALARAGIQVGDELVAEEVEVDPLVSAAALRATEQPAVELAGQRQVMYRNGEMER